MWLRGLMFVSMAGLTLTATTLIRVGLKGVGPIAWRNALNPVWFVKNAILNPYVFTGIIIQGFGLVLLLTILSREKLGVAMPLLGGVMYILFGLESQFLLGEPLSWSAWLGILFICCGVVFLSRSLAV